MTFDPAFRLYSDGSQTHDLGTLVELLPDMFVELDAELQRRREKYPQLVRKGRLSPADQVRELRVWAAITDGFATGAQRNRCTGAKASWTERVHCLRREINLRRILYPRWVKGRRLTQADADRQLFLVESVHDLIWMHSINETAVAARMEAAARLAA